VKVSNVYVLRTHLLNKHIIDMFTRMSAQLGKDRVFMLFDETHGTTTLPTVRWSAVENTDQSSIITIDEDDCQEINSLHNTGTHSGSMHKVEAHVYACYKKIRQDYDYLWLIEYDVYSNDFKASLSSFDNVYSDMLTKIYTGKYSWRNKNWFWWDKLEGEISSVPMKQRRRCFFPVNRFSKKFLKVIEQNLSKSSGYCEVYFPTLCYINGLVLKSMSSKAFGVYRYQPVISTNEIEKISSYDNRLYHPVK
jgi:hypothetical protein